jgi:propionate CoA-transferase
MSASRAKRVDVLSAQEVAEQVKDGDVVAVSGVVWSLVPERILEALEARFLSTGSPRNLTEVHLHVYGMGPDVGLERFAHEGMTSRVIGGSFAPPYWFKGSKMNKLIEEDKVEVFVIPAGVICSLWHEMGGGRPGVLTEIGIGSFVDPRLQGGMLTDRARASGHTVSEVVEIDGREWLRFRPQPIDVCLIRATTADEEGNLALEGEPIHQAVVQQAMATKASGGRVIAQVKHLADAGSIDPRLVKIPGFMVDAVVVAPEQKMFEYGVADDGPAYVGDRREVPPPIEHVPQGLEGLIARRAAREIKPGDVINVGAGLPVNVLSKVLREEGIADDCTISVEHGSLGGENLGELLCQTHWNPTSMMDSAMTFDMYTGGGLAIGFLGVAQVDSAGNVNVSKVGDSMAGVGGFMDIAQSARKVVFCGSLTYGGLQIGFGDGELRIEQEGHHAKFVPELELVSFSAKHALERGQTVLYVTERAVFELTGDGLRLIELAPGIDVDEHVTPVVDFEFAVASDLAQMPAELFKRERAPQPATSDSGVDQ